MTTRVLLTGFEPFDSSEVNPSWEAASAVAAAPPDGMRVSAVRLPCAFATVLPALRAAVRETRPGLVVCLGQAGGRPGISVERVAVNIADARVPDNLGHRPVDEPVVPDGPAAYFSTLPVKACTAAVRAAGVPASVSCTAGTFVCNYTAYGLAHLLATELPSVRGGFVHVPWLPEQVTERPDPSLPTATVAHGVRALLTAALHRGPDAHVSEGTTH
jgi:pyroglutamyl-peptidase